MSDKELTFEEAFAELEKVLRCLEEGGLALEESVALYERGIVLAKICEQALDRAELRVSQLAADTKENTSLSPF